MSRLLAACALLLIASCVPPGFAAEHVNVVILYADDLGYGDLGCYGHGSFKTPNLDRMAAEGARLTQFHTSCPYCAPSRGSLMTGRFPFRNGLVRNPFPSGDPVVKAGGDEIGLDVGEITLGQMFQRAGHATICIGKWHLGHRPQFWPTKRGFDEYFGIPYSNDMHPVRLYEGEKAVEFPVEQATLTQRYTDRAVKFIEQHRDRPFFLYFPHAMPHKPLAASERYYEQTRTGLYGDVITELDASVGRILATLKEQGLDDNTLVIFSSDNGPWYGGSTGGLRGMKGQWWEGGLRVPFIARWPGRIPEGHTSEAVTSIVDVFPTVLAAAGIDLPGDVTLDGRDIMPNLTSDAASPHEAVFGTQDVIHTVRSGDWKLHVYRTPPPDRREPGWVDPRAPNGRTLLAPDEQYGPESFPGTKAGDESTDPALFNLRTDPAEATNVAADHPEVVERLMRLYEPARAVEAARR